jgi:3-phenylpropionate/cinnamic acid dioxygenase small subunit
VTVDVDQEIPAIERVLTSYARLVDTRSRTGWEACFTPEARLAIEPAPGVRRRPVSLSGLVAIVEAFASATPPSSPRQLHQVCLRSIEAGDVNHSRLRTESSFIRYDDGPSGPIVGSFGRYLDEWECTDDGWRIRDRRIVIDSSVPAKRTPPVRDPAAEIRDVVLRYCRAVDRRDYEGVRACYHPDATDHHGSYRGGVDGFIDRIRVELPKCERTFHVVANVLVDRVAGESARCESYALAYHRLPPRDDRGPRDRLVALRYLDRFERRDGEWRIAERTCLCEWTRTDPVTVGWDFGPEFARGVPGPDDAIFAEEPTR